MSGLKGKGKLSGILVFYMGLGKGENTRRTFELKLNLHCKNCANDVKKIVLKIEGVDSVDIDRDLELGKATISGNVNPQTIIKKLKDHNKHAELVGKVEESPAMINHLEMQIVLQPNPVRNLLQQQKVAPQLPGNIKFSSSCPCIYVWLINTNTAFFSSYILRLFP